MILSLNHPAVEIIRFPDGQAHVRVGLEVPTTVDIEQRIRNIGSYTYRTTPGTRSASP